MKRILLLISIGLLILVGCESVDKPELELDRISELYAPEFINFEHDTIPFDKISEFISFDNVVVKSNEAKITKVSFTMNYNSEMYTGSSDCIVLFEMNEIIEVVSFDYQPIRLEYLKSNNLLTKGKLFQYINGLVDPEILCLDNGMLNYNFKNDQLSRLEAISDAVLIGNDVLKQQFRVEVGMNIVRGITEATASYIKDFQDQWVLDSFIINNEKTTFEPQRELIGRWSEDYSYNDRDFFGVLVINDANELEQVYEGEYHFSRSWPTEKSHQGTFMVTLSFDLENDCINFKAGDWLEPETILMPHGYIEFTMKFNEDMDMVSTPVNWEKQSNALSIFDQNGDTYDND